MSGRCTLAAFGAPLEGIRPEDFAEPGSFFRFGRDPYGFDLLPEIQGVDFAAAWERRVEGVIDRTSGLKAFFISAPDLIASKLAREGRRASRTPRLSARQRKRKSAERVWWVRHRAIPGLRIETWGTRLGFYHG